MRGFGARTLSPGKLFSVSLYLSSCSYSSTDLDPPNTSLPTIRIETPDVSGCSRCLTLKGDPEEGTVLTARE